MAQFQFLSDEWIEASRALREEYRDVIPPAPVAIRMNQIVTGVPFGEGVIRAHLDTSTGTLELDTGHLDQPDLTVTLDYDTARALLVGGDPAAAMAAFLGGKMKVDGDITKLLALQQPGGGPAAVDPRAAELLVRLQSLTA